MRRLILGVAFAFFAGLAGLTAGPARANDTIELTTNDVTAMWRNINEIVLVLSETIALDEDWIQELRDLKPEDGLASDPASLSSAMSAFRERLDVLMQSSDLPAATPMEDGDASSISAQYVRSGNLLDTLVRYLIDADSLASVAIYYANADVTGANPQELAVEINLANQRIDAFIEESGL